jgi:hypothetical protein
VVVAAFALAFVAAALALAPGAARADGQIPTYCRFTDSRGQMVLIPVGDVYKDVTERELAPPVGNAVRTTVYLCRVDENGVKRVLEMDSYCEGRLCRYDLGERPPPLIADGGTGSWGSTGTEPDFMDPDYGYDGPVTDRL